MRLLPLIVKHFRQHQVRTASTLIALAICIFMFCVLETAITGIGFGLKSANDRRLVTRHAVSLVFNMPITYGEKISRLDGVSAVAHQNWFGGIYKDFRNFFPNFFVDAENFFPLYPEYSIKPAEWKSFLSDRQGCVVGRDLATRFNWHLGDRFEMTSTIPPYQVGRPFEFVISAIYDTDTVKYPSTNLGIMFFHWRYAYEMTGRRIGIGTYVTELYDPRDAGKVSGAIDGLFANSNAETKTETESAFRAGFVAMAGGLTMLLRLIGLAVTFTILIVTANTMSMAVRERRKEIAVLKTLGFGSRQVLTMVLFESTVIALAGGLIGMWMGSGAIKVLPKLPFIGDAFRGFPVDGLSPSIAIVALGVSLLLGLAAGAVPALIAYYSKITDALRQV